MGGWGRAREGVGCMREGGEGGAGREMLQNACLVWRAGSMLAQMEKGLGEGGEAKGNPNTVTDHSV